MHLHRYIRLARIENAIQSKRGALQHVGGQVAKERAEDTREALTLLRERERDLEIDYDAWALLRETLLEAEQQEGVHLGRVLGDPIVQRFESWARARLTRGFSLDDAAKAVGSSKRTLARRMQSVLGKSPLSFFQSLRMERAVHLLKTGSASVDEVAARVGYAEGATLRTLLRRRLNVGIREIRKSF